MNAAVIAKHDAAIAKLDTIAELRKDVEALALQQDNFLKLALGEEGYAKYLAFNDTKESIQGVEASLMEELKAEVLQLGETVKGTALQAVLNSGRVTWDSKGLEGYAVANPQVLTFRKVGEPSVTVRANSNKKEK